MRPPTQAFSVFCPFIRLFINFTQPHSIGAKDGSRTRNLQLGRLELYQLSYFRLILLQCDNHCLLVGTGGFEPPKSKQQIYSLSHLATLVYPHFKLRAEEGTRTPDLLITNQWLYQLSYFGLIFCF